MVYILSSAHVCKGPQPKIYDDRIRVCLCVHAYAHSQSSINRIECPLSVFMSVLGYIRAFTATVCSPDRSSVSANTSFGRGNSSSGDTQTAVCFNMTERAHWQWVNRWASGTLNSWCDLFDIPKGTIQMTKDILS